MSLNPRAIATLGIGYGPRLVAGLGLYPVESRAEPTHSGGADTGVSFVEMRRERIRKQNAFIAAFVSTWTANRSWEN